MKPTLVLVLLLLLTACNKIEIQEAKITDFAKLINEERISENNYEITEYIFDFEVYNDSVYYFTEDYSKGFFKYSKNTKKNN